MENFDIRNVNKISIVGGSGSGKTTLAIKLGQDLNLPVIHLDSINYKENWVQVDEKVRDSIFLQKANEDKWIMDGTYTATMKERFDKSDLIIFLDYSTFAKLRGVFHRLLTSNKKEKADIPGCIERMNFTFFKFVLLWNHNKRKKIQNLLKNYENKSVILKNRRSLNKWYKNNIFNHK